MTKALILVDIQVDFLPGGALAVPNGDWIIPVVNRLQQEFDLVVASKDYHPPNHSSFREQGGQWPAHCVEETPGAEFAPGLDTLRIAFVVYKGIREEKDSYSCFYTDGTESTGLVEFLDAMGVTEVHIAGLALDYCVLHSALDAKKWGFDVTVHIEGCYPVDPANVLYVCEQMHQEGINIIVEGEDE
jgi:nicotinamidase/pyrazinamidase